MRTRKILGISLTVILCSAASAAESVTPVAEAVTPVRLAVVDAVIAFCREVAPADDGAYRALKVSLIGKQTDSALDAAERTAEYGQTLAEIRAVLSQAPRDFMRQSCLSTIGKTGRGGDR